MKQAVVGMWGWVVLIIGLLGVPSLAFADVGLPMIFVTYSAVIMALIPVILIETNVFQRHVALPFRRVARPVGIANAVSTIVGFPLTWIMIVVLHMWADFDGLQSTSTWWGRVLAVTWGSPWLGRDDWSMFIRVPIIVWLGGLVPAFFASVFLEGHLLKRFFRTSNASDIWRLTWKANGLSYLGVIGFITIWWGFYALNI